MTAHNRRLLFLALLCFFIGGTATLYSQTNENQAFEHNQNLHLIGKYSGGQVVLRWGPTDKALWEQANQAGYHVERLSLPDHSEDLKNRRFERLTSQPLKPATAKEWEAATEIDDACAAAYMVLFSELPPLPDADPFSQLKQQTQLRDNAYFIAMSAAELSAQAAGLLGLRFADKNIKKGERYLYRVFAATPFTNGQLDTALVYISTAQEETMPMPTAVEAVSGEEVIFVKWNISLNRSSFFAYHIERSDSPQGPFTRLNKRPLIFMQNREIEGEGDDFFTFTDSVRVNYRKFYYRITGITPYGEESIPSEVVVGMGKDLTPPLPPSIRKAEQKDGKMAFVEWEKTTKEPDLKGFIVSRSSHPEGPFTPLHEGVLPRVTKSFVDANPLVEGRNFYAVAALDTAGNVSHSLSAYVLFPDHTPPAPPTGLTGIVDTNGIVRLTWTPNREDDLMGYRVYWANDRSHKFIMIGGDLIRETAITDTIQIRTLTEQVYYRVAAVDNGFGHSDFSETIELKRPDVTPPAPGVFTNIRVSPEGIQLSWTTSTSSDLDSQELLRRQPGGAWTTIATFGKTSTSYLDEPAADGIYEYVLRSIDDDGLQSEPSASARAHFVGKNEMPPVEDLRATYNREKKALELYWQYPVPNRRFVVYRSVNGESWKSYESLTGSSAFTDFRIQEDDSYSYAVRAVDDATGKESALRETEVIRLK